MNEVLELAGGILPAAAVRHIEVQRLTAHEKRGMLSLEIGEGSDKEALRAAFEQFNVQDGDEIHIFPIAPYNTGAVYLEGHVLRPGRYSYREGMKLTDLIPSYKAVAGAFRALCRNHPHYGAGKSPGRREFQSRGGTGASGRRAKAAGAGHHPHFRPLRFGDCAGIRGLWRGAQSGELPQLRASPFCGRRFGPSMNRRRNTFLQERSPK